MSPLSPQQLKFVSEYLLDPSSQAKAAIRAGYSLDHAGSIASRLLKDQRIQKALEKAQDVAIDTIGITKARILQELSLIAFAKGTDGFSQDEDGNLEIDVNALGKLNESNPTEVTVSRSSDGSGKVFKQVQVKTVKISDKKSALELLGKEVGLFKDKLEVTGSLSLQRLIEDSFNETPKLSDQSDDTIDVDYQEVSLPPQTSSDIELSPSRQLDLFVS